MEERLKKIEAFCDYPDILEWIKDKPTDIPPVDRTVGTAEKLAYIINNPILHQIAQLKPIPFTDPFEKFPVIHDRSQLLQMLDEFNDMSQEYSQWIQQINAEFSKRAKAIKFHSA